MTGMRQSGEVWYCTPRSRWPHFLLLMHWPDAMFGSSLLSGPLGLASEACCWAIRWVLSTRTGATGWLPTGRWHYRRPIARRHHPIHTLLRIPASVFTRLRECSCSFVLHRADSTKHRVPLTPEYAPCTGPVAETGEYSDLQRMEPGRRQITNGSTGPAKSVQFHRRNLQRLARVARHLLKTRHG